MGVFTNGNSVTSTGTNGVFVGGTRRTGVWTNGINRLDPNSGVEFNEALADLDFSVTVGGVVTLSVGQGTIVSSTYHNGQILGPSLLADRPLTNTVVVRAPATGYTNSNQNITIVRSFTQPRFVLPDDPNPDPVRNTYSDWVNSGSAYNERSTNTTGEFGAWETISTPDTEQFLNERRCRTLTTTTRNLQDQTRTCTAAGGCDGALTRTIVVSSAFSATRDCQDRNTNHDGVSGIVNLQYRPTITLASLNDSCSVNRETGEVNLFIFYRDPLSATVIEVPDSAVTITSPSSGRFPLVAFNSSRQPRDVSWSIRWSVPQAANARNSGTLITGTGTCETFQLPIEQASFNPNVVVRNDNRIVHSIENGQVVQMDLGVPYFISGNGRLNGMDGQIPLTGAGRQHTIDFANGTSWTITVVGSSFPINPNQTAFRTF